MQSITMHSMKANKAVVQAANLPGKTFSINVLLFIITWVFRQITFITKHVRAIECDASSGNQDNACFELNLPTLKTLIQLRMSIPNRSKMKLMLWFSSSWSKHKCNSVSDSISCVSETTSCASNMSNTPVLFTSNLCIGDASCSGQSRTGATVTSDKPMCFKLNDFKCVEASVRCPHVLNWGSSRGLQFSFVWPDFHGSTTHKTVSASNCMSNLEPILLEQQRARDRTITVAETTHHLLLADSTNFFFLLLAFRICKIDMMMIGLTTCFHMSLIRTRSGAFHEF